MLRCSKIARRRSLPIAYTDATIRVNSQLARGIHSTGRNSSLFGFFGKGKGEEGSAGIFGGFFSPKDSPPLVKATGPAPKLPETWNSVPPPPPPPETKPTPVIAPEPIAPAFIPPKPAAAPPKFVPPKPSTARPSAAASTTEPKTATSSPAKAPVFVVEPPIEKSIMETSAGPRIRIQHLGKPIAARAGESPSVSTSSNVLMDRINIRRIQVPLKEKPTTVSPTSSARIIRFGGPRQDLGNDKLERTSQRIETPGRNSAITMAAQQQTARGGDTLPPAPKKTPSNAAENTVSTTAESEKATQKDASPMMQPQRSTPSDHNASTISTSIPKPASQPSLRTSTAPDSALPLRGIGFNTRAAALAGVPVPPPAVDSREAALAGIPIFGRMNPGVTSKEAALAGIPIPSFKPSIASAVSGNRMATEKMPEVRASAVPSVGGESSAPIPESTTAATSVGGLESVQTTTTQDDDAVIAAMSLDGKGSFTTSAVSTTQKDKDLYPSKPSNISGYAILSGGKGSSAEQSTPEQKSSFIFQNPAPVSPPPAPKAEPEPITFTAFAESLAKATRPTVVTENKVDISPQSKMESTSVADAEDVLEKMSSDQKRSSQTSKLRTEPQVSTPPPSAKAPPAAASGQPKNAVVETLKTEATLEEKLESGPWEAVLNNVNSVPSPAPRVAQRHAEPAQSPPPTPTTKAAAPSPESTAPAFQMPSVSTPKFQPPVPKTPATRTKSVGPSFQMPKIVASSPSTNSKVNAGPRISVNFSNSSTLPPSASLPAGRSAGWSTHINGDMAQFEPYKGPAITWNEPETKPVTPTFNAPRRNQVVRETPAPQAWSAPNGGYGQSSPQPQYDTRWSGQAFGQPTFSQSVGPAPSQYQQGPVPGWNSQPPQYSQAPAPGWNSQQPQYSQAPVPGWNSQPSPSTQASVRPSRGAWGALDSTPSPVTRDNLRQGQDLQYGKPSAPTYGKTYESPSYERNAFQRPIISRTGPGPTITRPAPAPSSIPPTSQVPAADPIQTQTADFDAFGGIEDLMGDVDDSAVVTAKGSDERVIETQARNWVPQPREESMNFKKAAPSPWDKYTVEEDFEDILPKKRKDKEAPVGKWGKKQGKVGFEKEKFVMDMDAISAEEEAMRIKAEKQKKKRERRRRESIPLYLPEFISVEHLAATLRISMPEFVEKMRQLGFENVNHDEVLNAETAGLIAMEYNYELIVDRSSEEDLLPRPAPEDISSLPPRPPVVTIMGHVDHGKTTLLDYLRKSSVAAGEHGGITQHIGAFSVKLSSEREITFLDTPGHAAFLTMRQRGANVTDIVVLVVAADDSVMPQTLEAIKHARAANVPMIVAVNKMDKPDANSERVKLDLGRYGVEVEDFGGDTQVVEVSGKTGLGMDKLEEAILTLSEIQDHRADREGPSEGWVIEASKEKRGKVATVLVKRGILKPGDVIVAGTTWARVRTLRDEAGNNVPEAGPGFAVEVDGWRDQPEAGDMALEAASEAQARNVTAMRQEKKERVRMQKDMEAINEQRRIAREEREAEEAAKEAAKAAKRAEKNGETVETPEVQAKEKAFKLTEVPFIVKADVSGSAEAVINAISGIGNEMIRTKVLRSGVGSVSEFDIDHAAAAKGFVISFNVDIDHDTKNYARAHKVELISHNIIYRLENDIKAKLESMLPPIVQTRELGTADVMMVFPIKGPNKTSSNVAGVKVKNGSITRNAKVKVTRGDKVVYDGKFSSLKHLKQDITEMRRGGECGLAFDGWQDFLAGDVITCYETYEQPRKL